MGFSMKKMVVFCIDAAPYMCLSMKKMQILYPNVIHVTCLAHGLHCVGDSSKNCRRYSTWIDAAIRYVDHYEFVKKIVDDSEYEEV